MSKITKIVQFCGVCLLIGLSTACGLSDLRPDNLPAVTEQQRQNGTKLLAAVAKTHGTRGAWQANQTINVRLRDKWSALESTVAMPWAKNNQHFDHVLVPLSDNARIDFLDGPDAGTSWGIQHWRTYAVVDGVTTFAMSETPLFWLPTVSYFIEAPFRMTEATTVYELPEKSIGTTRYKRVFFTWGDDAPQENTDQYIAWIDAKTNRLRFLQYTVRDLYGFITGCMSYEDYEQVGDFVLPKTLHVVSEPGGEHALHGFFVDAYKFNLHPTTYVIVDETKHGPKHAD